MGKWGLSLAGFWINVALFLVKLWAGIVSGSPAVTADALNSILDVFAYAALHISVRVQEFEPDARHPFGHRRAEPMASLIIAIFAGVLGVSIVNHAIGALRAPPEITVLPAVIVVIVVSVIAKAATGVLFLREARRTDSSAMWAAFIDSRNDAIASGLVLVGLFGGTLWDGGAALLVGLWVAYSGLQIGLENIAYLMGEAPEDRLLTRLRQVAEETPGVRGTNTLRAHHVGDRIHVELHIEVDGKTPLYKAHDIGRAAQDRLEELELVNWAFVHIDPWPLRPDPKDRVDI